MSILVYTELQIEMSSNKYTSDNVTVSVVSHGHGTQLLQLLCQLEALCLRHVGHVVLTVNILEPALVKEINARAWSFKLTVIHNHEPKGFGANHNAAFEYATFKYFCVINPDIDFEVDPFPELISQLEDPLVGCTFPVQLDEVGRIQDYARKLPSPLDLLVRRIQGRCRTQLISEVDWVNGAFMLFPAKIFDRLSGFDEGYFMYCEDVDICLRLQLAGHRLAQATAKVTHAARRNSRVNVRHLIWHIRSLVRLWRSAPYRQFLRVGSFGRGY